MMKLENLFKHKIAFKLTYSDIDRYEPYRDSKVLYFTTKFTKIPYVNLLAELKPFISFLHSSAVKNLSPFSESIYSVFLFEENNDYDDNDDDPENLLIITFNHNVQACVNFEKYIFHKKNFKKCVTSSSNFSICVTATYYFQTDAMEDFELTPLLKSFKTDHCIVCFENDPNILFTDCKHICICCECEKTTQFKKCPCCRSLVYERIKI